MSSRPLPPHPLSSFAPPPAGDPARHTTTHEGRPRFVTAPDGTLTGLIPLTTLRAAHLPLSPHSDNGLPASINRLCGYGDALDTALGPIRLGRLALLDGRLWQVASLEMPLAHDLDRRSPSGPGVLLSGAVVHRALTNIGATLVARLTAYTVRCIVAEDARADRVTLDVCIPCDEIAASCRDYTQWRALLDAAFTAACGARPATTAAH